MGEKYSSKPLVFDGQDFVIWKARMEAYLQSLGHNVWNKVKTPYTMPEDEQITADNMAQVDFNYRARNAIVAGLSTGEFNRVQHHMSAHGMWVVLCNFHEGNTDIQLVRQNQFQK